jgi:hypothetical protein
MVHFSRLKRLTAVLLIVAGGLAPSNRSAWAQSTDVSARAVLADLQATAGYRVLYRDALVAGATVALTTETDTLAALVASLRAEGLTVRVDSARRQVLIAPGRPGSPPQPVSPTVLRGHVVDDATGTRLPHATLTWEEADTRRGVAANTAGAFRLPVPGTLARQGAIELIVSYVGYQSARVDVDLRAPPDELTVRLSPRPAEGPEIVVSGSGHRSSLDTTAQALVRPGLTTPFGETSVIRALQPLPAVTLTPALTNGLTVRGSRSDGFQVLLDGMTIYNQSHLFGTFDAFNEEALQRVGFFYDVAPADLPAPPGGTLAFITRTGSQAAVRAQAGASNTALRATVEGPFAEGRGSVLVAGRHSYLNALSWMGSEALIAQGLDADRATSALPEQAVPLEDRLLTPSAPSARFYDAHGKVYYETAGGQRLTASAYAGGDRTAQSAERLILNTEAARPRDRIQQRVVETENRWGNEAASVSIEGPWGDRAYSRTRAAVSRYHSTFSKDDFIYTRTDRPADALRNFTAPFAYDNELVEWKLEQHVDLAPSYPGLWTVGGALHGFVVDYSEASALRPAFAQTRRSVLLDGFAQYDWTRAAWADVHLGLRVHYFSLGSYLRLSPRLQVRLFPERPVSLHVGYSRNPQFVHRLTLQTTSSADVWITSNERNAPSHADHVSAGLTLTPMATMSLRADAYVKTITNVWQHETVNALQRSDASVLFAPWSTDNRAFARGLELMHQQRLGPVRWTNSYALSQVELQNDRLNDGARVPAAWDRRHQVTSQLQASRGGWTGALTGVYATGTPNSWAQWVDAEPERLAAYHRLDASLSYQRAVGDAAVEIMASVFNLYDRANPWYRDPVAVLARTGTRRRISYRIVDVYDLGVQPAFNVSLAF